MGQHSIPQEYLRAFQIPESNEQVFLFDKITRKYTIASIKKILQKKGYFSDEDEEFLADYEVEANEVIKKIISDNKLEISDCEILSYYASMMIYRTNRRRRKGLEIAPKVTGEVISDTLDDIKNMKSKGELSIERADELTKKIEAFAIANKDRVPNGIISQLRSPWPGPMVYMQIRKMSWRLLNNFEYETYLTSDNPATFFEGLGLGHPDSELTMPLSPKHALIAYNKPGKITALTHNKTEGRIVREINRRVVFYSERFIVSSEKKDWVAMTATKPDVYLSKIKWNR